MTDFDPVNAQKLIAAMAAIIVSIVGAGLLTWLRIAKTRKSVGIEDGERRRFMGALEDAVAARQEAHDANNRVMAVQRELGRLEAENKACNERADRQDVEIAELKAQNKVQAAQIEQQGRDIRRLMRIDQARSELGGGLS